MHESRGGEEAPTLAPVTVVADGGGGGGPLQQGAVQVQQPIDHDHDHDRLQAAAGGGGALQLLQQLIDFGDGDTRLQAARFFLLWGVCVLTNAMVLNPAANLEHKFVGLVVLTAGAWLVLLTLAGDGAARVAARAERFLRRFFF